MNFNTKSKTVSGSVVGQYYEALKILAQEKDITGTMIVRRGIESLAKDFAIDIDKLK